MIDQPLISVVVPVYNAELFVGDCLESLLLQTYACFEIIVIDDGSTDHSASLIEDYVVRDSRIKLFRQQNAGVSVSRNRAISYCKGDYLTLVDADDKVGKDYLQHLLSGLTGETGKGVVIGGLEQVRLDGSRMRVEVSGRTYRNSDFGKLFAEVNLHHYWYAASKLYNLSLIREKKLRFEEQLSYAEDALFLLNYLKWADFVRFCPVADYFYMQHTGSSLSRSKRSFSAEFTVYRKMTAYVSELKRLYPGMSQSLSLMDNEIAIYLIRALPGLYRPPFALSRKVRTHALKELQDREYALLRANYRPYRLFEKIGKWLLLKRFIRLYDLYMSLVYKMLYSLMSKPDK